MKDPQREEPILAHRRRHQEDGGRSRSGWLLPALFGFLAGTLFWYAIGFWSFMISLVHGFEPESRNVSATIARVLDPEGWERVAARWDDNAAAVASVDRNCAAIVRAEFALQAGTAPCPKVAELREVPGVAPRNDRQALVGPLAATFGTAERAPVAGWAARVADDGKAAAVTVTSAIETPAVNVSTEVTATRSGTPAPVPVWVTDVASGN